jgi:hypothetical protein
MELQLLLLNYFVESISAYELSNIFINIGEICSDGGADFVRSLNAIKKLTKEKGPDNSGPIC